MVRKNTASSSKLNQLLYTGSLIGFIFLSGCKSKTDLPPAPPNIIFIMADDLGYGELGCYGQTKIETPNIDDLARRGMRFTQAYSGSPVCAPARCVLLTGRHTGHAYIRGNDEWGERGEVWNFARAAEDPNLEGQRPLPVDSLTVAEVLKSRGYATGMVGKWGLGGPLSDGIPNNQGFDFFFGYNCQRQAHTYFPLHLWKNREKVRLDNPLVPPGTKLPEGADPDDSTAYANFWLREYSPDLMQKEALGFIEQNKDNPFFLYYATPISHAPLQAPPHWVDHYRQKFGPEAPYVGDKGYFPNRTPHAAYAAMISYLDEKVGELVTKLRELGLEENTLIVFTSDNGPTYNGGTDSPYFNSAGPFKSEYGWGKGFVHEGGIREPFIACWPGKINPGSESLHQLSFYDVMPTLAELTGAEPPPTDGISFLPALMGKTDEQAAHEFLYWEFPEYDGQQAVRMGDWKGIRLELHKGPSEIQLFDLKSDPAESHDIASGHPEIVEKIRRIMETQHKEPELTRFRMAALGDEVAKN